jgi:hypothetical protein
MFKHETRHGQRHTRSQNIMPYLFREIVFCECGRPAMVGTAECRTCYEDALRRKWRDERRVDAVVGVPEPIRALNPLLRRLQAPEPEEDGERDLAPPPLRKGGQGGSRGVAYSVANAAPPAKSPLRSLTATR